MAGALGGPRVLLRRLREVMAEPVSAQERLDKIVVLIAANMVAEVCSIYVLRVDGSLELYATEGLKPEAVHVTVLGPGEGLVGLIAREANRSTCRMRTRTRVLLPAGDRRGDLPRRSSACRSCAAGNTLGVLVVQNRGTPHLLGGGGGGARRPSRWCSPR